MLAELELVSGGKIASYAPVGTGGAHGSRPPIGLGLIGRQPDEDHAPHMFYREEMLAETDPGKRDALLAAARQTLAALRTRTVPTDYAEEPETAKQRMDRMCAETEGTPPREVGWAQGWLGMAPSIVIAERISRGRDPLTGRPADLGDDMRSEVLRLDAAGLSQREIAKRLKVSQPTVHRTLRKSA